MKKDVDENNKNIDNKVEVKKSDKINNDEKEKTGWWS